MRTPDLSECAEQRGLSAGTWGFPSPHSPIPIRQASFCSIFLHIGIPTFFPRIVDRLS